MKSTRAGEPAPWVGVSVGDRYAPGPRASDVCGLSPVEGGLAACFWTWEWEPPGTMPDVGPLLDEVRAARCVLLDGPQGLARPGREARACEVASRPGRRTPDHLPGLPEGGRAGIVRASIELAAAFFDARVRLSPVAVVGGLGEIEPDLAWRALERFGLPALPGPETDEGRRARRVVLEALGVQFPAGGALNAPRLDATLAALTAAASDGAIRGVHARARGEGVFRGADGLLREGPIVELTLQGFRVAACRDALEPPPDLPPGPPAAEPPPVPVRPPEVPPGEGPTPPAPAPEPDAVRRAEQLFDELLARFARGRPLVVTYAAAHALFFPGAARAASRWSPELAEEVRATAAATGRRELPGLGPVALDTFVVDSTFGTPGRAHWATAGYTIEAWRACFGLPEVAGPGQLRPAPAAAR